MNYRHAFHAGSFADVFKHAVLCRVLTYLCEKPAAFRVIDTHAGAGLYDLTSSEASRGGEWHDGIERLLQASLPQAAAALLKPYVDVVAALNEPGKLAVYPGSPALVRAWLRPQDRLIACEFEPQAQAALARHLRRDTRINTLAVDGWTAGFTAPELQLLVAANFKGVKPFDLSTRRVIRARVLLTTLAAQTAGAPNARLTFKQDAVNQFYATLPH